MRLATAAALLVLGACGAAEPPTRPAWDQDVLPLLQGSCNGCHGETAAAPGGANVRLDFCASPPAAVSALEPPFVGGALDWANAANIKRYLVPDMGRPRALMPPPPASPLSDYELTVLRRWARIAEVDAAAACKKAVPNRRPTVEVLEVPYLGEPDEQGVVSVETVIEVLDRDADGILGKATLGSFETSIPGGGRRTLKFPREAPLTAPLELVVTDGQDTVRLP